MVMSRPPIKVKSAQGAVMKRKYSPATSSHLRERAGKRTFSDTLLGDLGMAVIEVTLYLMGRCLYEWFPPLENFSNS